MVVRDYLKTSLIVMYKTIYNTLYTIMTHVKKHNDKKAVFILSRSKDIEGNSYYIYEELLNQLDGVKIHLVYTENKMNLNLFKELFTICNARYLILDDYYLPIYLVKPNKRLKVIQLWHAAGAFKKFGYSTIGTQFGPADNYLKLIPIHSNYTHVYVSSKNIIPFYAEAFNMSMHNIYPLGIPRIDLFKNEQQIAQIKNKLFTEYPLLKDDKSINILIAPTYRAGGIQKESSFNISSIISNFITDINKDVKIIFKAHPYMSKIELVNLEKNPNVVIANKYEINEWMLVSDAFITDYSSSIFDFALLERPIAHYVPDIDDYTKNRGLYQSIEEISDGAILRDEENLVHWINTRKSNEHYNTSRMVHVNFDHTENVAKKIVSHFIYS
ncbi:CDP-glycerol glycerophosphotransferase family protein [Pseudogracilibacillus sp. SE30717A]|uniref:CDP-glycerol glycerophosphotransferase family protein n=1 Tax=Pseudogracilibacillus sp. SE30717A TaxID=3098293 RepID=UPI00300DC3F9